MSIFILLLLIPIYVVALVFNFGTLYQIVVNNDLNYLYAVASLFVIYVVGFGILSNIEKVFKDSALVRNLDEKVFYITNNICISLCFLFGICFLLQGILYKFEIINIIVSCVIITIFILYIYSLNKTKKDLVLTLINIDSESKFYDVLLFEGENDLLVEYAVKKNHSYKEDKTYLCRVSMGTLNKIIKEVIDIKVGEKNE